MCRFEPARTGTLFSDECWGMSPHITDCNQLQVSIFPQFPSMPLDFALSPHCKFSPLTDTLDNLHGSRAGQCENNSLYALNPPSPRLELTPAPLALTKPPEELKYVFLIVTMPLLN